MIVAGGPGTSLLDLGEGEDSNLATGQVMAEMRRRFLRRRQAYVAWLLTDLVVHAYNRWGEGTRSGRRQVTHADITADMPDISVEDNRELAAAAADLARGLNDLAKLMGDGPAFRRLALRLFVKFAGEQVEAAEFEEIVERSG